MKQSMFAGLVAAALAAASWSLGYIAPFVIGGYSPFDNPNSNYTGYNLTFFQYPAELLAAE